MSSPLKLFFIAQTFLTRIPAPKIMTGMSEKEISHSILFYPVIGLLIGLVLTLLAYLFGTFFEETTSLATAIILTVWVLITGALHLDGVADTIDGLVGGQNSTERTLKIMKDPVTGPMGIVSIFLILMLKYSAIMSILDSDISLWGLLLAPFVARAISVGLLTYTPAAQEQGLAFELKKVSLPELVAIISLVVAIVIFISVGVYGLIAIALIIFAIRHWTMSRLNGITGDVLGFSIEIIEAVFLVTIVLASS